MRVFGVGWPGFRNFPEWNLRFYVSHEGRRGVCFVREFVPQWTVATMARVLYNEPYRSARMSMDVKELPETLTATYGVSWGGRIHSLHTSEGVVELGAEFVHGKNAELWALIEEAGGRTVERGGTRLSAGNSPAPVATRVISSRSVASESAWRTRLSSSGGRVVFRRK